MGPWWAARGMPVWLWGIPSFGKWGAGARSARRRPQEGAWGDACWSECQPEERAHSVQLSRKGAPASAPIPAHSDLPEERAGRSWSSSQAYVPDQEKGCSSLAWLVRKGWALSSLTDSGSEPRAGSQWPATRSLVKPFGSVLGKRSVVPRAFSGVTTLATGRRAWHSVKSPTLICSLGDSC